MLLCYPYPPFPFRVHCCREVAVKTGKGWRVQTKPAIVQTVTQGLIHKWTYGILRSGAVQHYQVVYLCDSNIMFLTVLAWKGRAVWHVCVYGIRNSLTHLCIYKHIPIHKRPSVEDVCTMEETSGVGQNVDTSEKSMTFIEMIAQKVKMRSLLQSSVQSVQWVFCNVECHQETNTD